MEFVKSSKELEDGEFVKEKKKKKKKDKEKTPPVEMDQTQKKKKKKNKHSEKEEADTTHQEVINESEHKKKKKKKKKESAESGDELQTDDELNEDTSSVKKKKKKKHKEHVDESHSNAEIAKTNKSADLSSEELEGKKAKKAKKRKHKDNDDAEEVGGSKWNLFAKKKKTDSNAEAIEMEQNYKKKTDDVATKFLSSGWDVKAEPVQKPKPENKPQQPSLWDKQGTIYGQDKPGRTCDDLMKKAKKPSPFDKEPPKSTTTTSPVEAGQWATASMDSDDRQNKFLRLMGGFKNNKGESSKDPGKKKFASFALDKRKEEKLKAGLANQYDQAQETHRQKRGMGLGFSDAPMGGPQYHWGSAMGGVDKSTKL